jgi:hypothetical protein
VHRLSDNWSRSIGPRDRRSTHEWARDNVILVPPLTKTGPFDSSISRHLEGPLCALDDDHCREVNVLAPVRGGKTLIADVYLCSVIGRTPGATRWVFQDDKAAKDQAELRTWPIIEANEWLDKMLPGDRHKARNQEIIFPGMPLHISGPSLGSLQSRGYQFIIADEAWLYKDGRMEELRGRLGDYVKMGTDKLLVLSQGGEMGSEWDNQCSRGVLHDWEFQCLSCGKYLLANRWTLKRADGSRWGLSWDKHKLDNGLWDIPKVLPSVRFECEHCGHPHMDGTRTKTEWNRTGRYRVELTDKNPKRRTFHWTSIIDFPWEELVDMYLQAVNAWRLGNPTQLIQFFQKRTAEMKSENSLIEEMSFAVRSTYEIDSKWPDEVVRIMTVDRQDEDVYWWTIRAWAKDGRSRRLGFGKAFSPAELETVRDKNQVEAQHVLIDSGYRPKGDHGVYSICIRYGWIPVKGHAQVNGEEKLFFHQTKRGRVMRSYSEPILCDPEIGTGQQGQRAVERIDFSAPTYSDRVQNLIDLGLWEEPQAAQGDLTETQYRKQMAGEYKKRVTVGSLKKEKMIWYCPSGNNHAFDCAKMQALGATLLDILPDELPSEVEAA